MATVVSGDDLAVTFTTLSHFLRKTNPETPIHKAIYQSRYFIADALRLIADAKGVPPEAKLIELPHSEVCMHMKVAGTFMWVSPHGSNNMVQLYDLYGDKFSFPILKSEAGWRDPVFRANTTD